MPSSVKQSNFAKKKKPKGAKGQKVSDGAKKRKLPKRNAPRSAKQILALRYARQKAIAARKRMAGRSSSVKKGKAAFSKRKK